jgi:tRNA (cmo5U34)-methyltransferase
MHFLSHDEEWEIFFKKLFQTLKPNGSLWISDLVDHSNRYVQTIMWKKYSDYLIQLKDQRFRNHVFASIEKEATTRSLHFQIDLLKKVGFNEIDILHKHSVFAAFGAIKRT